MKLVIPRGPLPNKTFIWPGPDDNFIIVIIIGKVCSARQPRWSGVVALKRAVVTVGDIRNALIVVKLKAFSTKEGKPNNLIVKAAFV
mmetsp:Transcript_6169/g.7997  ORF Transcript_6169/g.7997 Transcript_6169/m.7997 type:complete len:87 (+) Transcript_6169:1290-1550(+)